MIESVFNGGFMMRNNEWKYPKYKLRNDNTVVEQKTRKLEQEIREKENLIKKIQASEATKDADIKGLKQKLENLEEEIEDLEDENNSQKKKINTLRESNKEAQKQIGGMEKVIGELNVEVDNQKNTINNQLADLTAKQKAINFVYEILTAKQSDDQNIKVVYDNIEKVYNFILSDVKSVFDLASALPNKWVIRDKLNLLSKLINECDNWRTQKRKTWLDSKRSIAFVGEFSAGKTSIVNRILSQDNPDVPQLPVSTEATTAIATYVTGGDRERFEFIAPDNVRKVMPKEVFIEVDKKMLSEVKGINNLIKYFVMSYKNVYLKNLSVLDTPGFSSNDPEDAQRTLEVINECDALFWVMDVNAGTINRTSLDLIKKYFTKKLYIVINKVDTKAPSEVESVLKLVKSTFEKEKIKVASYLKFSKKENLNVIMELVKQIDKECEYKYLDEIRKVLNEIEEVFKKAEREAYQQYQERRNTVNKQRTCFEQALTQLRYRIPRIKNVIRFDNGFFWDDYRIEVDDYKRLINELNGMDDNDIPCFINAFENQMELVKLQQEAHEDYIEAKVDLQYVAAAKSKFDVYVKKLD